MKDENIQLNSLLQRSNIESNKQFQRLSEKTQVLMPQNGQLEIVKNRLTHSYEVATSSLMMASNIAALNNIDLNDIDFKGSLYGCALLHDVGHGPFGHDGADLIDQKFKALGVDEGFSDNNNNLVVIRKNNIVVNDYTIASVIKYPTKLYSFQKEQYIPILNAAINEDKTHFSTLGLNLSNQTKTISCQIMDEADRNSYATSDFADFLCLGNTIDIEVMHRMSKESSLSCRYRELITLSNIIKDNSKTSIKAYFNELKNRFNCNYNITDEGLIVIDKDLEDYREFLYELCLEFYIYPIRDQSFHKENMKKLESYMDDVISGKCSPSEHYTAKINTAKNDVEKYTYMRDMIAEVSDWYILNYYAN